MKQVQDTLELLKHLISIPSLSKNEGAVSDFLFDYIEKQDFSPNRKGNNIWIKNKYYSPELPTILLNSHLDTVKPCDGWTIDPYLPVIKDQKLYGLGSNDAGVSLVCLLAVFQILNNRKDLNFNLIFSATAEEEISGVNGIQSVLPYLGNINLGIIGEPTNLKMAVAEKGLIVLDCYSYGKAGHAANNGHDNAILNCLDDLQWIKNIKFNRKSTFLGETKASVTQINAGTQHNVIPDKCHFVIDIRVNDLYSNEKVLEMMKSSLESEVKERSLRLRPSVISLTHPVVKRAEELGLELYGSHSLSDQALLNIDTVKIGPGDSNRSHIANEFIYIEEIENGIKTYVNLLDKLKLN